ncbi:hypothetical protein ROA7450_02323 [Roseovarius albus]|uniref:Uncharacterized protein n=1 Tax=Roseovarius albus TaxID=1247867 RepID=A0A1X6ZE38_9RHOB|nr:hypothetical protein ROA7450_02323 [Roseovarius albus]
MWPLRWENLVNNQILALQGPVGHTRWDLFFWVRQMTNQVAVALGILIVIALCVDGIVFDWANTVFVGQKFVTLVEWLAFWR